MQEESNPRDKQMLQYLHSIDPLVQQGQIRAPIHPASFITQVIFKTLALVGFFLFPVFQGLLSSMITIQLILIFVVIDFWFTKNINGRKMLGIRWSFGEDQYNVQRLVIECRINEQYVNGITSKLFWLIQFGYLIVPIVNIGTVIVIAPNLYRIRVVDVILNTAMLIGGTSNLFFFWKATITSGQKQVELKKKYGSDFLRKMGDGTIVIYS